MSRIRPDVRLGVPSMPPGRPRGLRQAAALPLAERRPADAGGRSRRFDTEPLAGHEAVAAAQGENLLLYCRIPATRTMPGRTVSTGKSLVNRPARARPARPSAEGGRAVRERGTPGEQPRGAARRRPMPIGRRGPVADGEGAARRRRPGSGPASETRGRAGDRPGVMTARPRSAILIPGAAPAPAAWWPPAAGPSTRHPRPDSLRDTTTDP